MDPLRGGWRTVRFIVWDRTLIDNQGNDTQGERERPETVPSFAKGVTLMRDKTITTKAGDHEYSVTVKLFESLDEAHEAWNAKSLNPDDVLLGILNAAQ